MSNLYKQWPDLGLLHLLLANEDMARSPDVWFNIHQLLLLRISQDNCPETPEAIACLLGPLVCKSPQQQQHLLPIIEEWLTSTPPLVQATVTAPKLNKASPSQNLQERLRPFTRRYLLGTVFLTLLLALLAFGIGQYQQDKQYQSNPKPIVDKTPPPISPIVDQSNKSIPITDWVKPNLLLPPIKLSTLWQEIGYAVVNGLPLLLTLLWLIWRYRSRKILREQQADDDNRITGLSFNHSEQITAAPFAGPEISRAANRLIRPLWIKSQRLHIQDSVLATANHFGFFTPVFQQRPVQPKYIVLVQSIHGKDQVADVAKLLIEELKTLNVAISSYRFRDDPRRLIPWSLVDGNINTAQSLTELAFNSGNARLIIISDWDILFHPYQPEQPQAWIAELDAWKQRVWLSPGYDNHKWAERAREQAQSRNIRLLPLAGENIHNLANWLSQDGNPPAPPGQIDENFILPEIFSQTSESWLEWRPPHGISLKKLIAQLRSYLGDDGFLLLQALAVFPKPLWSILQMLDIQLFSSGSQPASVKTTWIPWRHKPTESAIHKTDVDQQRQDREKRLLKISRLPWSRHTHMPDFVREQLLKALNRQQFKTIGDIWNAVLEQLITSDDDMPVDVPIAVPKKHKLNIQYWLDTQRNNSVMNDAIFANILLGHKLGLLDFRLPQALDKLLPGASKWLDLRPVLIALVMAVLSLWGLNWVWQHEGKQALSQYLQTSIEQENAQWPVELAYQADTQNLANTLQKNLTATKFTAKAQPNKTPITNAPNTISYATGGLAVAQRLAEHLTWLTYGANPNLIESANLSAHTLQVQLTQTYQHTAVFHDTLRNPYQAVAEIKEIKAKISGLALEPDLVIIPAGSFLMGSPDSEPGRSSDEGPQHQVTIAQSFALGKYEVTFAEYDRYAKAAKLKLPADQGWGRSQRPVINVSFNEAQAYVQWLSEQSGRAYRLPTEAEWEYAARAGTITAHYWHDKDDPTKFAWFADNSEDKTHPVGEKAPNAFGLYDMSGNVWEFTTQDCRHDNYQNAPVDRSAWISAKSGECVRRVVRGGSWNDNPQNLRSSNRIRNMSDANINTGFRVARAL